MSVQVAGRELDARVAVEVIGWGRQSESWYDEEGVEGTRFISPSGEETTCFGWGADCTYDDLDDTYLPRYSEDIAAAWQVVEKFKERGWDIGWHTHAKHGTGWFVTDGREYDFYTLSGDACESAPLAICRAAIAALQSKG